MIDTKTKTTTINKTTIKESLIVSSCTRCGNHKLEHIIFNKDNMDTSWEEDTILFSDGYFCEDCNVVLSKDEDHSSKYVITERTDSSDIRSSNKKEDPYSGAFSKSN